MTEQSRWRKVTLNGVNLWAEPDIEMGGALAPTHHVTPEGNLNLSACFSGDSYAHYYPGTGIKRYGEIIGQLTDLVDGWPDD